LLVASIGFWMIYEPKNPTDKPAGAFSSFAGDDAFDIQFMKGGTPLDFFGGSISSGSSASSASGSIRIVLKDGRVLTIPFPDIDRIEFVK